MPSMPKTFTGKELSAKLLQAACDMTVDKDAPATATGEATSITRIRHLIQEGLDDVIAGRLVPIDNARAWADSLDTQNERPLPRI
jgi:predicted transcriptional regulator